jgi:hypothetical protein
MLGLGVTICELVRSGRVEDPLNCCLQGGEPIETGVGQPGCSFPTTTVPAARVAVCVPGTCGIPTEAERQAGCKWWQKYQMRLCDCQGCDCPQCITRPEIKAGVVVAAALIVWKMLS